MQLDILCMDEDNLANVKRLQPKGSTAQVALLGSYDPKGMRIVQDPYYGGEEGFVTNFQQITRACVAFLESV